MGTEKRERQKAGRQARVEAAHRAQKQAETRRRVLLIVGLVAFVGVIALIFTVLNRDDGDDTADEPTTTTTSAAAESAAGKPCVPLAEPLPPGAPDVPITPGPPPTELVTEDLVVGTGDPVPAGATVDMQYIGVACSTGAIFDSSWGRGGEPLNISLDQVIPGWTQGVPGMQVGGRRLLVIPPDLAYGAAGSPPAIAPDETLFFVVDLVAFTPPGAEVPATPGPEATAPEDSATSDTTAPETTLAP
jgi:peptidylprolyl isomerase